MACEGLVQNGRAGTTEAAIAIYDPGRVVRAWELAELLPVEVVHGLSCWKDGRIEEGQEILLRKGNPSVEEILLRLKARPGTDTDAALYHDICGHHDKRLPEARRAYLPRKSPETEWARVAHAHLGRTDGGTTLATEINAELDSWGVEDPCLRREHIGYMRAIDAGCMIYRSKVEGRRHDKRLKK